MAKMIDASTMWKCETCFHYKNGGCSYEVWCENGEGYRPDYNKLVFIEAEPVKHGKWIQRDSADYECTECGFRFTSADPISMFEFCRCGARMDGDSE